MRLTEAQRRELELAAIAWNQHFQAGTARPWCVRPSDDYHLNSFTEAGRKALEEAS